MKITQSSIYFGCKTSLRRNQEVLEPSVPQRDQFSQGICLSLHSSLGQGIFQLHPFISVDRLAQGHYPSLHLPILLSVLAFLVILMADSDFSFLFFFLTIFFLFNDFIIKICQRQNCYYRIIKYLELQGHCRFLRSLEAEHLLQDKVRNAV